MKGSAEIGFTILSMTVSLAAVFIPIVFMGGIVGRLLHEFAVTIVLAILISGFVSVTLTPMLCSRFLKAGKSEEHGRFYQWSEKSFDRVQSGYERSLKWSMGHRTRHHAAVRRQPGGDGVHVLCSPRRISSPRWIPARSRSRPKRPTASPSTRWAGCSASWPPSPRSDPNVEAVISSVGSGGGPRTGTNTGSMLLKLKTTRRPRPFGR